MKPICVQLEVPVDILNGECLKIPDQYAEDKRLIIRSYLSTCIGYSVKAGTSFNKDVTRFFKELLNKMEGYRLAVRRDDEFRSIAIATGLDKSRQIPENSSHLLANENVGLLLSSNPRDEKFMLKTIQWFFRKMFDANAKWNVKYGENMPSTVMIEGTPKSYPAALENHPGLEAVVRHNLSISFSAAMTLLFYGASAKPYIEALFETTISEDDIGLMTSYCHSPFDSIYIWAPEYWKDFCEEYVKSNKNDFTASSVDILIPQILNLYNTNYETAGQLQEAKALLAEQAGEADDVIVGPKTEVEPSKDSSASDEAYNLTAKKLEEAEKKCTSLESQLGECDSKINRLRAQIEELTSQLKAANDTNTFLNNQLIDAYESSNILFDDEQMDEPDSQLPSCLKERLGEENLQLLLSKRVLVAGGHSNTHNTLRELFPNWTYEKDLRGVRKNTKYNVDVVLSMTSYCSHGTFTMARLLAKNSGVNMWMCQRNSPLGVCEALLHYFSTKK